MLATTGRRIGSLVMIGCLALLLGALLLRAEPRPPPGRAVAGQGGRGPPDPAPTTSRRVPAGQPLSVRRRGLARPDHQADPADTDPFPALTFVPVVVDDDPDEGDGPARVWPMVEAPAGRPLREWPT